MTTVKQIKKENQLIACCEKSLALEKLKKRKVETRRKIELGGLVIKSGMGSFNKAVILGALNQALKLIEQDKDCLNMFESKGNFLFNSIIKD
ncbi:TPA: conjugal transfer protein TraD [Legionella pneumophila]|nr:conjugal transfer protein TraD [Legionella pneumophila]HDV5805223.1 conjugal transfer protein TraD [Legionella pneumophila]